MVSDVGFVDMKFTRSIVDVDGKTRQNVVTFILPKYRLRLAIPYKKYEVLADKASDYADGLPYKDERKNQLQWLGYHVLCAHEGEDKEDVGTVWMCKYSPKKKEDKKIPSGI
jgi:hypothetical protein